MFFMFQIVEKLQVEIDQILGKPPKTNYFNEYDYIYWLGPERGFFGIDSEWLVIKFRNSIEVKF